MKSQLLSDVTVEYCFKITYHTSQGNAATVYRWGG